MKIFQLIDLIIRLFRLNKKSKVVLLFLIPTFLLGQNNAAFWLGQRPSGAAPTNLLLDDYPGAAAAYSLRKLDKDYGGFAVEVRRSSDGNTQNIGFSNGDFDTASLNSFCSGTSCTVRTWYDQSGNGKNAVQTTVANQPLIYASGSVILEDVKPAISFDGSNDYLILPNFASFVSQNLSNYFLGGSFNYTNSNSTNPRYYDFYDGANHIQFLRDEATQRWHHKNDTWQASLSATQFTTQIAQTTQFLAINKHLSASNDLILNSVGQAKITSNNVGSAGTISTIGVRADIIETTYAFGKFQEIIVYYENHLSATYNSIASNINAYYSIY